MSQKVPSSASLVESLRRGIQFLRHLPHFVRLYWRLFRDPRVSLLPKGILVLSLLYLISPVDILSDVAFPFLGEVDDLIVFLAACKAFIYLCPPAVVEEHVRRLSASDGATT